jgi:hypothetical protein
MTTLRPATETELLDADWDGDTEPEGECTSEQTEQIRKVE